jgi:hypothetical protein
MLNDVRNYRLECLKLSLETNSKIGNLKSASHKYYGMTGETVTTKAYETHEEINEALKDVFTLADMFLEYLKDGENPCDGHYSE